MSDNELHEKYIKILLNDIFTNKIGDFLAFKGGTLAYLLHELDRFSTDIDLDLIDIDREQDVVEEVRKILSIHGDIKNETLGKSIHRWIFRYDEKNMNIKVEINKTIHKNNNYEKINIENININCMSKESIFSNKLVALSERFYNRDLYDVHFFFRKNFPLQESLIIERTDLTVKEFLGKLIKELPNQFRENTILSGLGEVLNNKQKHRVKKYLLSETIEYLENYLNKV
ncbi:MAG TPA: nucleotidyl transferase AbiEii/AbiGii toxin family protein [Candidatus Absconditabacterales bacterium]|nr:nucleotidyl transferase AbiEii/AbiGii toxin family protein [Candidatus Absconditabacterales bacterium]